MYKTGKNNDGMKINKGFEQLADIFNAKTSIKPPAYEWQELALRIINELNIPNFKRSSVFKICKELAKPIVESSLNDTKELCKTGEKWKYFFKLIDNHRAKNNKTAT